MWRQATIKQMGVLSGLRVVEQGWQERKRRNTALDTLARSYQSFLVSQINVYISTSDISILSHALFIFALLLELAPGASFPQLNWNSWTTSTLSHTPGSIRVQLSTRYYRSSQHLVKSQCSWCPGLSLCHCSSEIRRGGAGCESGERSKMRRRGCKE